jgi:DNA-directed RNA polymerase specialized sigma24 family protein
VADAASDLWEVLPRFPASGRFEPWCYTVLRNRQMDRLRRERTRRSYESAAAQQRSGAEDLRQALFGGA